jgi:hypothetical protein
MGADVKGIEEWIADLEAADAELLDKTEKVVGRGMFNIKRDWKARWTGYAHIPHLPNAINYDVTRHGDDISGEVGPDKNKRQGPLGNLIEFGSENNAPIPGGLPALAAEEPKFTNALADMLEKLLDGRD